jgi:RNA polymerase sigma-54 factor
MGLEQRQIQSQKLILSPQLRQYLKLLQLPLMELCQAIEQELSENPMLEETSPEPETAEPVSEDTSVHELNFQSKMDQLDRIDRDFKESFYPETEASEDDLEDLRQKKDFQESIITKATTLADYLLWQLNLLDLDEPGTRIAREIIGNIDEDGYFKADLGDLSQGLQAALEDVEKILRLIQTLDPPGVGARDLREALLIQLSKKDVQGSCARRIVEEHFQLLERKHFSEIAKKMGVSDEAVKEAFAEIARLEPKPGRIFYAHEPTAMVPDATVTPDEDTEGKYRIEIHHETIPRIQLNAAYRKMLKDKNLDRDTKKFLKDKMTSALTLIRAIGQRKNTLRAITEELVKAQADFFDKGFAHLKPLRLRDIAEKIGIHESTVSRAISGKYIVTPQGTIPYRSFFSNRMETEDGSPESKKSIMERIKTVIDGENKKKPLSDEKIVTLLKTEGILIARRTVAKYRDLLKILPTHLRKVR